MSDVIMPQPSEVLRADDRLVVFGETKKIDGITKA
jgi:Trk K+ transport system NAD-binding subunit